MNTEDVRNPQNCLIIGGNSFLGINLISKLLDLGDKVRIFDISLCNIPVNLLQEVESVIGDLSNRIEIAKALLNIDVVFYFAYSTNVISSIQDIYKDQQNVSFALNILEEVRYSNVKKVVFASSGGTVYGEPKYLPMDEDHPLNPISPYGISKVTIENYLHYYHHQYKVDYCSCRFSNPYGKYQNPLGQVGAITVFIYKAYLNESITIFGDPKSIKRDFIYINDLIEGLLLISFSKTQHKIYNLGNGVEESLFNIISVIHQIFKIDVKINLQPAKIENITKVALNVNRIKSEFNWEPKINLQEGMTATYNWLTQNFKI